MKFKYLRSRGDFDDWELEHFTKVDNPLPYNNLPCGKYMIRGDKKEHRKEYLNTTSGWYLTNIVTKDNGHYMCDATKYKLFPSLPEAKWDNIRSAGFKRLNKYWQRSLVAHDFWLELRALRRRVKLDFKNMMS